MEACVTELLEKLQVPGLILAGIVIFLGYRLFSQQLQINAQLTTQLAEHGAIVREVATQVKLLCQRLLGGQG
jgi:hypothetical protein